MPNPNQKLIDLYLKARVVLSASRKLKASRTIQYYISIYLSHLTPNRTPSFHQEIYNYLNKTIEDTRGEGVDPHSPSLIYSTVDPNFSPKNSKLPYSTLTRLLFVAPRGFAKSSICSRFYPLWLSLFGYKKDIFLVSATISLAKENLRFIRNELENNEKLIEDFGEQKSDKWTEDYLLLRNGTTIRAKGRGFQIRGFRPDLIVCDDLEDEEIIYSKEQRDKLENWFFRTLIPALKPDQTLVYIGTKLHQFSLISKLEEKPEFLLKKYQAITNGLSIWEDLWTLERLKRLRTEMGTYAFESEFQNNPISLEEQPIKAHYLEGVKIAGQVEMKCLVLDPAISERQTSDYRAISIFGRTGDGFKELYSEHGKWPITEQVEKVIDLWGKFGLKSETDRIILEMVGFQKVLKDLMLKEFRKRKIWLPITEAELGTGEDKRPKDKLTRLLGIAHLFEQRLVEIVNPELKQELLAFPFGDYDDLVDTCVYALHWLMKNRGGKTIEKKSETKLLQGKSSFFVEEVRPGVFMAKIEGEPKFVFPKKSNFINFNR